MKLEMLSLTEIIPAEHNPRKHPSEQITMLAKGIQRYGFNVPILVDDEGRIVAGHARFAAADVAGLKKIPAIRLSHLNEEERNAFMVYDNKIASMSSWEPIALADILDNLTAMTVEDLGFSPEEVDRLHDDALAATLKSISGGADDEVRGPTAKELGEIMVTFSVIVTEAQAQFLHNALQPLRDEGRATSAGEALILAIKEWSE